MPLVLEKPNYPPYVCLVCGVGERRKWYVDLQLPIDNYFNPVTAGAVYICNECWESISIETNKQAQILLIGQEPWDSQEYINPTYEDETELISAPTMKERLDVGELRAGSTERTDSSTTENDGPVERNDSSSEPDNIDEQAQPLREFGNFFGGTSSGNPSRTSNIP